MRTHAQMILGGALVFLISTIAWGHVGDRVFLSAGARPSLYGHGWEMTTTGTGSTERNFAITTDQMFWPARRRDFARGFQRGLLDGVECAAGQSVLLLRCGWADDTLKMLESDQKRWWSDDIIQITFDADHSGGDFLGENLDHVFNGQR